MFRWGWRSSTPLQRRLSTYACPLAEQAWPVASQWLELLGWGLVSLASEIQAMLAAEAARVRIRCSLWQEQLPVCWDRV